MPNYGDIKVSGAGDIRPFILGVIEAKTVKGAIVSMPKWFLVDRGAEISVIDYKNLSDLTKAGGILPRSDAGGSDAAGSLSGVTGFRMKVPVKNASGVYEDRYCDGRGATVVWNAPFSVFGADQMAYTHCTDGNNYSAHNQSWDGLSQDPRGPNSGYNYENFW